MTVTLGRQFLGPNSPPRRWHSRVEDRSHGLVTCRSGASTATACRYVSPTESAIGTASPVRVATGPVATTISSDSGRTMTGQSGGRFSTVTRTRAVAVSPPLSVAENVIACTPGERRLLKTSRPFPMRPLRSETNRRRSMGNEPSSGVTGRGAELLHGAEGDDIAITRKIDAHRRWAVAARAASEHAAAAHFRDRPPTPNLEAGPICWHGTYFTLQPEGLQLNDSTIVPACP